MSKSVPERIPAPDGGASLLPERFSLRGFELVFVERQGVEARYRGLHPNRPALVRECPQSESAGLKQESELLQQLSHPALPEFIDAFLWEGHYYLVTALPQGMRLDNKMLLKTLQQSQVLAWGEHLCELLRRLEELGWVVELRPQGLVRLGGDIPQLLDLWGLQRVSEQAGLSWKSLGSCLLFWLTGQTESSGLSALSSATQTTLTLLLTGHPAWQSDSPVANGPLRVAAPDGSKFTCLPPSTRLAGYELQYLTRGGQSLCYLGVSGEERRFLKEVRLDDQDGSLALRREFEVLKKLRHPQVVTVHQLVELNGYLYLVMDYVQGSSLAQLDLPKGASQSQLLDWGDQLCEVLQFLHTQNPPLIYRDLKPANVILTASGELVLIDFGFVRTFKSGQSQDTQALGTFSTASPEHFTGQTDARSDLFSLAATLFLLACPGFKPSAPFTFPPLRQLRPDLSESLEQWLAQCLHKDPQQRPGSARELGQRFAQLLGPRPAPAKAFSTSQLTQELVCIPNITSHIAASAGQLIELLLAGKAQLEALQKVSQDCKVAPLSELWRYLAREVSQGQKLSDICGQFPKIFNSEVVARLDKGEWREAGQLLERQDLGRRTLSSARQKTSPVELSEQERKVRSQRRKIWLASAGLAMGLGIAVSVNLSDRGLPSWQPPAAGLGVTLGIGLLGTLVTAIRDARQMRVLGKAQNLIEDAWTSHALGENQKAEEELGQALVMARDGLGVSHLATLTGLHSLANLCREKRQFARAQEYYVQALSIYQRVLPTRHQARAQLHQHWAQNYEGLKNYSEALKQYQLSLEIWNQMSQEHPMEWAETLFHQGRLLFEREQDLAARESLSQSLEIQYAHLGLKSPLVHSTMSYLTRACARLRMFRESEPYLSKLLKDAEHDLLPDYAALAEANLDMGLLRLEESKSAQAEPYFLRALQLLQHYVGPSPRLLKKALDGYRRLFDNNIEQAGVFQLVAVFLEEREKIRQSLEAHPEWLNARDNTGWGPLQWATFMGREDILRWLLGRGADPGYDSGLAMGPLHVACAWDRSEALFLLLEKDPDVNVAGPGGWTPIFWCCLTGQYRLLEMLLKRGAEVNALDDLGRSPLHIASAHNHLKVVAALLGAGAAVNRVQALGGATPLHLAAERGHLALCDCLVYNGANVNVKDHAGQTPYDLATRNQHALLARAMRRHLKEGLGKATLPT